MYKRRLLLDSLKLFDLALMLASFALSMLVVSSGLRLGSFEQLLAMRIKLTNLLIFIGFMVAWHVIFSLFELDHSRRLSSVHDEIVDVAKATCAATVILLAGAFICNIRLVTLAFLAFFWASAATSTMVSRLTLRYLLRHVRSRGQTCAT